jgi:hypothetical protein
VPSSAALPVLPPAASRSACRPVTRATDHRRLRAGHTTFRDHPSRAPGWSLYFAPDGGSRCLTRS